MHVSMVNTLTFFQCGIRCVSCPGNGSGIFYECSPGNSTIRQKFLSRQRGLSIMIKMATCSSVSDSTSSQDESDLNPAFTVGETFSSFIELEKKVKLYEEKNFMKFWKREARTIAAARKRVARPLNEKDLKYYQLKYCCIHGGQQFRSRGTGSRSSS